MSSRRWLAAIAAASIMVVSCAGPVGSPPSTARSDAAASVRPTSDQPSGSTETCPAMIGDPASDAWWRDRVFYEIFVRSFADSDGDGIGDLRGLIGKLDHLNDGDPTTTTDLGVTGIWLMPVAEAASYHGYDVTDYRAIEHDYGTADDFRTLIAEAHRRGIAVIVDLVLNHTSIEHPWFQDSRIPGSKHADWYRWSDTDPGYAGSAGQQVWYPDGGRFYYAQFWSGMPDLDLTNPAVTSELTDVARFWLQDMGVDGFRLDAAKHLVEDGERQTDTPATHAWLADFDRQVRAIRSDALLVGEVYDLTIISSSYVPDAVDLTFDFELAGKMVLGAQVGEAPSLASAQRDVLERYSGRQYGAFLTNHDQARVMTELGDLGSARVAASVLLTNPGLPFVYYGEELGMAGDKPDERIRTPMPWDATSPGAGFTSGTPWEPLEPGWNVANVASERADPASLLAHYRALIAVRAAHPVLITGAFVPLGSNAPTVYAFISADARDTVAVIVNLGATEVADYRLSADAPAACGVTRAATLYADAIPTPSSVEPIQATADGRFETWRPVLSLPGHSTLIVDLSR
jgi:glycosidase